jgi:hypothetical protein
VINMVLTSSVLAGIPQCRYEKRTASSCVTVLLRVLCCTRSCCIETVSEESCGKSAVFKPVRRIESVV